MDKPPRKFDISINEVKVPKGVNESGKGVIVGYEWGGIGGNERLGDGWNYYIRLGNSMEVFVFIERELIDASKDKG